VSIINHMEFIMNAHHIRLALAYTACGITGYAIGCACAWIITVASLGTFLAFLCWLIAMLLAYFVGEKLGAAVYGALDMITDARVANAKLAVTSRFASLKARFA
jgi:hypothetical protein